MDSVVATKNVARDHSRIHNMHHCGNLKIIVCGETSDQTTGQISDICPHHALGNISRCLRIKRGGVNSACSL